MAEPFAAQPLNRQIDRILQPALRNIGMYYVEILGANPSGLLGPFSSVLDAFSFDAFGGRSAFDGVSDVGASPASLAGPAGFCCVGNENHPGLTVDAAGRGTAAVENRYFDQKRVHPPLVNSYTE
jgi:hypothetical protein